MTPPHHHEHFSTREWRVEPGQSEAEISEELREPGLLRAKGFIETADGLRLLQLVGRRIEFSEPDSPPAPELVGRVVLIQRTDS